MTSDNAVPVPGSDEEDLAQFGYSQRLKRSMTTFTSFCLAFSMIAITGTLGPLLGPALSMVGGIAVWFWVLAFIGVIWIVLVFMHMAARIPVTGYAYQWTSRITSPYFGWVVALVGIITFTTGATSIGALFGSIVAPELGLEGTNSQIMWLGIAAVTFCFAINIVGIRYATRFNNGVAVVEIVFTAAIALLLLVGILFFFKNEGFGLLVNSHGVAGDNSVPIPWQNYVFAATAPIFSLMGWEASADLAEETKDPRRSAPRAMFRAVAICSAAGLIVMAIFVAAIPTSVPDAVEHPNMMFWIVQEHFGRFPALVLELIAFASLLGCIVANVAVATRLVYSVSRDGLMPFSATFSKVSPRWQTPVNASIALWIICLVVQVAGAGNIFRITSMAVIAYYLTYALTMVGVMVGHKLGRIPEPKTTGYFGLGKALLPVASLGLLWSVAVVVVYLAPAENHYIIGYFGIALGIGAILTVYAWSALKSGKAKMPEAEATEGISTGA